MGFPIKLPKDSSQLDQFETEKVSDGESKEYENLWFSGTLMRADPSHSKYFYRLAHLHNRIVAQDTGSDSRFNANTDISRRLAEFFPLKWLTEITAIFRDTDTSKLTFRYQEDRILAYLAYIDLILIFRGLTLLDSTLEEINHTLGLEISKDQIRSMKMRLLNIYPKLKKQYIKISPVTPRKVLFGTVIRIMNNELSFNSCSEKEIFTIKHKALDYCQLLSKTDRIRRIKRPETWARAICLKAFRDSIPNYDCMIFPDLCSEEFKIIENKRWQLDKLLKIPS
jgi:hypothetical protein